MDQYNASPQLPPRQNVSSHSAVPNQKINSSAQPLSQQIQLTMRKKGSERSSRGKSRQHNDQVVQKAETTPNERKLNNCKKVKMGNQPVNQPSDQYESSASNQAIPPEKLYVRKKDSMNQLLYNQHLESNLVKSSKNSNLNLSTALDSRNAQKQIIRLKMEQQQDNNGQSRQVLTMGQSSLNDFAAQQSLGRHPQYPDSSTANILASNRQSNQKPQQLQQISTKHKMVSSPPMIRVQNLTDSDLGNDSRIQRREEEYDDQMVLCNRESPPPERELNVKRSTEPQKPRRKITQEIQATDYWSNEESIQIGQNKLADKLSQQQDQIQSGSSHFVRQQPQEGGILFRQPQVQNSTNLPQSTQQIIRKPHNQSEQNSAKNSAFVHYLQNDDYSNKKIMPSIEVAVQQQQKLQLYLEKLDGSSDKWSSRAGNSRLTMSPMLHTNMNQIPMLNTIASGEQKILPLMHSQEELKQPPYSVATSIAPPPSSKKNKNLASLHLQTQSSACPNDLQPKISPAAKTGYELQSAQNFKLKPTMMDNDLVERAAANSVEERSKIRLPQMGGSIGGDQVLFTVIGPKDDKKQVSDRQPQTQATKRRRKNSPDIKKQRTQRVTERSDKSDSESNSSKSPQKQNHRSQHRDQHHRSQLNQRISNRKRNQQEEAQDAAESGSCTQDKQLLEENQKSRGLKRNHHVSHFNNDGNVSDKDQLQQIKSESPVVSQTTRRKQRHHRNARNASLIINGTNNPALATAGAIGSGTAVSGGGLSPGGGEDGGGGASGTAAEKEQPSSSKRRKFVLKRKQMLAKQKAAAAAQQQSQLGEAASPEAGPRSHRAERRHRRHNTQEGAIAEHDLHLQRERRLAKDGVDGAERGRHYKAGSVDVAANGQSQDKLAKQHQQQTDAAHGVGGDEEYEQPDPLQSPQKQKKLQHQVRHSGEQPAGALAQDQTAQVEPAGHAVAGGGGVMPAKQHSLNADSERLGTANKGSSQLAGTVGSNATETTRQQQKDLKILQKCFHRSLERMQQNYEGSVFLQNKEAGGDVRQGTAQQRSNSFWQSPRVPLNGALLSGYTELPDPTAQGCDDSGRRRREGDWQFPPPIMPLASNAVNGIVGPTKPRTSGGISRDQVSTSAGKVLDGVLRPGEDFGKQIKILRDSLNTSHKTQRQAGYQQVQSPLNKEGLQSFSSAVHSPNQTMRASTLKPAAVANNASYLQHAETPTSGTLRSSIPSPAAKQHSFRKQLNLQADPQHEQHHLVLIESSGRPSDERFNSNEQMSRKGEITLKAIKMSRIVGQAGQGGSGSSEHHIGHSPQTSLMLETIEPMKVGEANGLNHHQVPAGASNGVAQATSGLNDSQMKLKIITTQIPQSLLIPNTSSNGSTNATNRHLDGRGSSVGDGQGGEHMQLTFAARNNQHVIFSQQQSFVHRKGASIKGGFINGFLVPTNQFKQQGNYPPTRNGQHNTSTMPPSLTAINVQQTQLMAREAVQNSQFHSGAYNPAAKSILPGNSTSSQQRRIVKKKTSQSQFNQSNQMKLARRQIQFYQKRLAEKHMTPNTPKMAFVTERILFKRRQRLQDQNLLIFYFDGVIGELCTKNVSYGYFKVRHGAWQSLRKLSYKYQIAILIPYVKARAKVIACYFDKFQGCPVDAIYCIRSSFLRDHSDLRFIDYSQIYEDFDIGLSEKLIDKCIVIAPRTKEVSSYHMQNLPSEPVHQSRFWANEKNQPEENIEELKLIQMYLVNNEMQMSSRLEIFQFQGCPANLSPQLQPPKRRINYLHNNEETLSPGAIPKNKDGHEKEKQTATQANKIAVELGQQQKPVTLFVPHTKNVTTVTSSFLPICKVIEDLAVLDEHCKARRENTPLRGAVGDSFDSTSGTAGPQASVQPSSPLSLAQQVSSSGNNRASPCAPHHPTPAAPASLSATTGASGQAKQEVQPFSLIDAFYAFKTLVHGATCSNYTSLLKTLFAVETKKVQTFLYKDSMVGRVLLEKAEIKKCYQFTQRQHAQADRTAPTNSSHYIQMKNQNEFLKRYIIEYQQAYYSKVKETMDEAKIMRMTAYFMNQFSQRLVEDKNKKPNQHLREMFHKEISYDEDLPSRNINLFKNHRFLIMVKSTGQGSDVDQEDPTLPTSKGPQMETIDMQKIMGNSYFRQLEQFRQGGIVSQKQGSPEILPPNIIKILFKQRNSDMTEWFTKKAFSKPIQLLEKQQMIQERKEQILRGEQEKAAQISGYQPPASANERGAQSLPPFHRSHTIDNVNSLAISAQQDAHAIVPKKGKDGNNHRQTASISPNKHQRQAVSRGKTVQLPEKST